MKFILILGAIAIIIVGVWSYKYTHQVPSSSPTIITPHATVSNISITYTGTTFTPTSTVGVIPVTINIKNTSPKTFLPRWREGRLTNGQCREGTSYGACTPVAPGDSWTGSFDSPGVYEYYDQLSSSSPKMIVQINPPTVQ